MGPMRVIRRSWLNAAACGGMFVFGIVMALLGAVLPLLSGRIHFELARSGTLFLVMNCAMLVSMLVLGPLMDRCGKKSPLAGGSLLVALALFLVGTASSYNTLVLGVVLLGAGGGALNGATNTLIADLYSDPHRKNSALNLLGVFLGFGALSLPFVIGSLLTRVGLMTILTLAASLCLALAVLFIVLGFPPPKRADGVSLAETWRLARNPLVLLFGSLLFFQSGNEFVMGGFTSTYLIRESGSSITTASYVLAAYWGSIMLGRVVSSRLLLRIKGSTLLLLSALGSTASVSVLLIASTEKVAILGVVLIGLSFASIYPTVLGLAGTQFEESSGTVFGVLFAIALTGGMTLPWAVGQIAETYGLRSALLLPVANSLMILGLQLMLAKIKHMQDSMASLGHVRHG